ncbi:hypothetical protein [Niastella caeni]|nr:hypothetical protein [Niastella caeni]
MADNPMKKKADAKRISQQDHEQAYQRSKAKKATGKKSARKKTAKKKTV